MYVHRIDPIIVSLCGVHLWWYGLSYTLGFLSIHFWLRRRRDELRLGLLEIYDLTLLVAAGVLIGGRLLEVLFYEWPFYSRYPHLVPAYWLGGMATHGLLLGGVAGTALFCVLRRRPFLEVADALMIPAALTMGLGRIGNFIDGQIVGSVTNVWWSVRFPDAEGFRHPVVLYDGLKNLMIIPLLLWTARRRPPAGVVTAVFLFLYAFLRVFVDVFREYRTVWLGLGTGQILNMLLALLGLALFVWCIRRPERRLRPPGAFPDRAPIVARGSAGIAWRRGALVAVLLFCLTIPSDWTQDIPARYGGRHPGLQYSLLYPRVNAMRGEHHQATTRTLDEQG